MATVGLYTLGCKVSQYETEAIREAFEKQGYVARPFEEECDVYVINTCTVTAESDRKSRQIIRRAIGRNPDAVVLVTGCYSQTSPEAVAAIPGVSAVTGSADKLALIALAEEKRKERAAGALSACTVSVTPLADAPFEEMTVRRAPRTRAYVKIEDGCECRCTYCEIPHARGPVRSKRRELVIEEVEALHRGGTREIVLTGIETASYGRDFADGYRLVDLLEELNRRHSADRIRLGSLTPEMMTAATVARLRELPILVPHFHLSVQSGSDAVLVGMRRRYNRQMALDAVARLREALPRVQFTTDLMVGFPGETEESFRETLDFVRQAQFLDLHVFAYSRRPGTPAADFPGQIPEEVKHRRSAALIALGHEVRDGILDRLCREREGMPVVFETRGDGYMSAHSDTFVEVRVPTDRDLHGEIYTVIPEYHKDGILYARLAE